MGALGLLKGGVPFDETQEFEFRRHIEDEVDGKVPLQASWFHVKFMDEALVEEANTFPNSPSLGILDFGRALQMLLQDGFLLEAAESNSKNSSDKKLVIRADELGSSRAMEHVGDLEREDPVCLLSKFVQFNNFVGMPIAGFEKEISSFLKNLEERKGRGVKISGGKRNLVSRLERELRKLRCVVSYNSTPCSFKGKGRNNGGFIAVLSGCCFISSAV